MDWTPVYVGAGVLLNVLIFGIWKPWGSAYAGEKGKNFARKEDLNEILAEVRAVTVTQKEIESKLSGDLWSRQMHWNQKRDIYGELLSTAQEVAHAFFEIPAVRKMMEDTRPEFRDEGRKNHTNCLIRIRDGSAKLSKTFMLALIFLMPESAETLKEFIKTRPRSGEPPTSEQAILEGQQLSTLVGTLVVLARKDLGIT